MTTTISADNGSVSGSAGLKSSADSSGILQFQTGANTAAVTIDASQNVGLGVTPSTWYASGSGGTALQIGASTSIYNFSSGTNLQTRIYNNAYLNASASEIYQVTGALATKYIATAGTHQWHIAPSGTAGNAITFTQAMTLDASGNLGVGTTSPAQKLHVSEGVIRVGAAAAGSSLGTYEFSYTGSASLASIEGVRVTNNITSNMVFSTAASGTLSEKMRLDSSGNLLVGTTSTYALPGSQSASVFTNTGFAVGNGTTSVLVQNNKLAFNAANFYVVNGNTATGVGVYIGNGNTSWSAFSDERLKDIIEPISDAANKVSTLRAVIGKYKNDAEGTRRSFLIAQDVQAVLPEAVDASNPDKLGVQYTEVIPLLVAAIKEIKAEFDAYKLTHP